MNVAWGFGPPIDRQDAIRLLRAAYDRGVTFFDILRPGWFTRDTAIDYRITQKGEPFRGHDVSLNSLSDLIVKLALNPTMEVRRSLGVSSG